MATLPDPVQLVRLARRGDRGGLVGLLELMVDLVYPLAICMLGSTCAAGDATETIVIRLVTTLGTVRHDGAVRTWVCRVASRHLLNDARAPVMLLFLDRELRIAFALGDVLALATDEAASVLAVSPDVFHARRSRARSCLCEHYGLVDPAALFPSLVPATLAADLRALITGR